MPKMGWRVLNQVAVTLSLLANLSTGLRISFCSPDNTGSDVEKGPFTHEDVSVDHADERRSFRYMAVQWGLFGHLP